MRRSDIERMLIGRIEEVFPDRDSGLIKAENGEIIFFHRKSVERVELEDLGIGDRVSYEVRQCEGKPQAMRVGLLLFR